MRDPVTISGQIGEKDFMHAQWLHIRPRPWMGALGVVLFGLMVVGGVWSMIAWLRGTGTASDATYLPFLAFTLLLLFAVFSWSFRRNYQLHKAIQLPFRVELSDDRFFAQSELGEARLPWNLFHKLKQSKHTILLYHSSGLFHILPKRLFASDADRERAIELLREKVDGHG